MNRKKYLLTLIFYIISGIFLSVQTGHFELKIKNIVVEIKLNNETLTDYFCNMEPLENITCIKDLQICIHDSCSSLPSKTVYMKPIAINDNILKISSVINVWNNNSSDEIVQINHLDNLSFKVQRITMKSEIVLIKLNVSVNCQSNYLAPNCSQMDLCKIVSPGICQNNGNCTQFGSKIGCICPNRFSGDFCQDKVEPCQGNMCDNNSTCVENPKALLKYSCLCPQGFTGDFCNVDIDECSNSSLCLGFSNSTCMNTYGSYICLCGDLCQFKTTESPSVTTITENTRKTIFDIKWPLTDLPTLLLVTIQGALIVILILILICTQCKRCFSKKKSKLILDDNHLYYNPKRQKKETYEFEPNYVRQHVIKEEIQQSLGNLYEDHDINQSYDNDFSGNGMSTFGRR